MYLIFLFFKTSIKNQHNILKVMPVNVKKKIVEYCGLTCIRYDEVEQRGSLDLGFRTSEFEIL